MIFTHISVSIIQYRMSQTLHNSCESMYPSTTTSTTCHRLHTKFSLTKCMYECNKRYINVCESMSPSRRPFLSRSPYSLVTQTPKIYYHELQTIIPHTRSINITDSTYMCVSPCLPAPQHPFLSRTPYNLVTPALQNLVWCSVLQCVAVCCSVLLHQI